MRLPLLLIAGLSLAPAAALADDLSGTWKVDVTALGRAMTLDCHFVQKDKALGGTCARKDASDAPAPLTGVVDGLNARWAYDATMDGQPTRLAFDGNVEGTTITGAVIVGATKATFAALKQ